MSSASSSEDLELSDYSDDSEKEGDVGVPHKTQRKVSNSAQKREQKESTKNDEGKNRGLIIHLRKETQLFLV